MEKERECPPLFYTLLLLHRCLPYMPLKKVSKYLADGCFLSLSFDTFLTFRPPSHLLNLILISILKE